MILTSRQHRFLINGFDESGIDNTCPITLFMQQCLYFFRSLHHTAYGEQCNAALSHDPLRLPQFNGCTVFSKARISGTSGIAHRNGCFQCHCEFHHIRQLPLVFRCTDVHIGNTGQIRIIENSLMCLSVTAYQVGTVYGKYHRQILNAYIMKDLVICSL